MLLISFWNNLPADLDLTLNLVQIMCASQKVRILMSDQFLLPCLAWNREFLSLCLCLIRFCQLIFFSKISKLFWRWKLRSIRLFWHPAQLIKYHKSWPKVALKMSILLSFWSHARQGLLFQDVIYEWPHYCCCCWQRQYLLARLHLLACHSLGCCLLLAVGFGIHRQEKPGGSNSIAPLSLQQHKPFKMHKMVTR